MKNLFLVMKEQKQNSYLTKRLASYELKNKGKGSYLGMTWELLNPLLQLLVYWFVFQSVREGADVKLANGEYIPFVYWLIVGFVVWFFFYKSTIDGSSSIYSRIKILSKMNFPMSIIPSFVIVPHLYIHTMLIGIVIVLLNLGGYYVNTYYLQLAYFIPSTLVFLFAIALITSTLSTIIRDIHIFLNSMLRMFLYLSPVLWQIGNLDGVIGTVAKLSPLYYLIEGYRSALFGTGWYLIDHWEYTLYFWIVTFVLLLIGTTIHVKFRRHFIDFV